MINRVLLEEYAASSEEMSSMLEEIKTLKKEFEESIKEKVKSLKEKEEEITKLRDTISVEALEEYKENGRSSKKLSGGIGIREKSVISYDEEKALEFAKEKDLFLSLDKKTFEKSAPTLNLSWVTVKKEETVTFPKMINLEEQIGASEGDKNEDKRRIGFR